MKLNVSKEYLRRLEQVLKSKLNSANLVQEVNTWTVSLLGYSVASICWRNCELQSMDRKTRKLFKYIWRIAPKD